MCEDTNCMHHDPKGRFRCKQGIKMTCRRRYDKLGLKYRWVELKK